MDGGAVLKPKGRRPGRLPSPAAIVAHPVLAPHAPPDVLTLPHPDWIYQELTVTVTGDGDALWSFRQAAAGAGHVPWAYDYDALEEHWLSLMLSQPGRTISLQGAKIVAREVKEAFRDEHEEACAWVGRSKAVPLDLHQLVPVPWEVLRLGPDAPASLRWLWRHWGTTWSLRRPEMLESAAGLLKVGFWSADWTPWPAIAACRARWDGLTFALRVSHAAG